MFITWNSFQAGDTSNIATSNLTLPIVNGVLKVSLVPTTTATAGAQYNVTYNSKGITQFTEVWAVPPSSLTLRVRDVRIAQGTVVGPAAVTTPIQIGDVTGLTNELAVRPMEGVGFAISRTAVINPAGQIDGASGTLSDCVRVDGSSGPCGGGGISYIFSDSENPTGAIDGVNAVFVLAFAPSPPSSLSLFRNGLRLTPGVDYSLLNKTITFVAPALPVPGDVLNASYRYGNSSDANGSSAPPQVICSAVGNGTTLTSPTTLGTCTIPAGTLESGDRIEVQFQYSHAGSTNGFSSQVLIGGTSAVSRSVIAGESLLVGKIGFSIGATGQIYDSRSVGSTVAEALAVGIAAEPIMQSLTITFMGNMSATGSDTVNLSGFTVVRYPAQTNP